MPTLSEDVDEGVVVTWFVVPGAVVGEGDLVAEVQVEKVSEEVRAPAGGRLVETLVEPGGIVRQGAPIAVLDVGVTEGAAPEAPARRAVEPEGPRPPPPPRVRARPASGPRP